MTVYIGHDGLSRAFSDTTEREMAKSLMQKWEIPGFHSAYYRWNENEFQGYIDFETRCAIDSGGFNVLQEHDDYPWTVEQYHEWLVDYPCDIDFAATMDYLTGDPFSHVGTVRKRQEMTIDNYAHHCDIANNEYYIMPVLQGETIDDYVRMYDMYYEQGLAQDYMAVGGLVGIKAPTRVVKIERAIREHVPGDIKLHGFGVKLNEYKHGATFETSDNNAWSYYSQHGMTIEYDPNGPPLTKRSANNKFDRWTSNIVNYWRYVKDLKDDKCM